ncbi:MAG: 50S ribosomal protein L5 [Candidatus Saccharibacteria bacterium]|nr:50S ribosomal protein L5 [Candidatus Saccharibacteria bacterium]
MRTQTYQPTLKQEYFQKIRSQLKKDLHLKNIHQAPYLEKIILNSGLGRAKTDKQLFATAENTLTKISGQKPILTIARMSVASFKLRTGNQIGAMLTLRDIRMYEFLERLIHFTMPRFRDFRGASLKSFDRSGNYSLGFREQSVFPELSFEETNPSHGLQATLVFSTNNTEHNKALLEAFGFQFENKVSSAKNQEESHG